MMYGRAGGCGFRARRYTVWITVPQVISIQPFLPRERGLMNQDDLLVIIEKIYEAATDRSRWPAVLQIIADAFGAQDASLSAVSPVAVPWLVAPRTDPSFLQSYGQHYHPLNLFWDRMTRVPVGTAVTDRMVLRQETLRSSPFYNEWSRPQNYLSVMGATLLVEDQWRLEFVVPGKNAFGPEQIRLYDALAPHLKRAVQLTHRLQSAELDRAYSHGALNSVDRGMLLVDAQARVLFANEAAKKSFNAGLKMADGVLCSTKPSETARLHLAIADPFDNGGRNEIAISRAADRAPLSLTVIPLRHHVEWISRHAQAAIVFVDDPEDAAGRRSQALQQQFRLTRAEAALVEEMLKGGDMAEVAARLGIAPATARTHLHRIFRKTGTTRQSELVHLALSPGGTHSA
jgi:DNA-binding CsgD family transcriptional regulator/PAS domain-containing protein